MGEDQIDFSGLLGPSVLTGGFGTPNSDLFLTPSSDTGGDINFLTNVPSGSVFNPGTPAADFIDQSSATLGIPDLSGLSGLNIPGGLGSLFSGALGSLSGLMPSGGSSLTSILPGAMALGYAASQPNLDLGNLNDIMGALKGNQNAVIKAATDPLQMNIAGGYGDLLQSQALRGIRGSSFGDTDIANYLSSTGNALANAGANAAQGSLALQGSLATQIANLQNQRQQLKNNLYGTAFDVLGRGLNPKGYAGSTNINVGTGGGGTAPASKGFLGTGIPDADIGIGLATASLFSDRRLKTNITKIADDPRGFAIYEYDIDGKRDWGVMADEVERVMPAAVTVCAGYKMVDYGKLWEAGHA